MEPDRSKRRAEEVFADWLKELDTDREGDLAPLCAAHPELESELRKLHRDWRKLRPVLDRARANERLPERLAKQFGADVDPGVSLDEPAGPMPPSAASNKLLQSLASRGLSSSRYRLLGEIARGGMGAILKVWDEDLRRHLAMKVVLGKEQGEKSGDTPPNDPRLIARFLEEAQITGQLDHPGIVPVHELGLAGDGRVYFTMRLVKGRDLKQIFELAWRGEDGWSTTRALGVILRACEAMGYAHAKGVVHRDLKPANVMVGRHGEVYVMDWGLARVVGKADGHDIRLAVEPSSMSEVITARSALDDEASDSPLHTMDGDVVGTPTYMSPEQARGAVHAVGQRSDVYAIGAMLYHLLARTPPFVPAGEKISQRVVLMRVLHGPPEPLAALAPETPPELTAICDKAMARDANERYGDVQELAEDLRAFLENRVVRAYRTGATVELKKWVRRNRGMAASIIAALLVAIGGLASVATVQASANRDIRAARDQTEAKITELSKVVGDLDEARRKLAELGTTVDERQHDLEEMKQQSSALQNDMARRVDEAKGNELDARQQQRETDQRIAELENYGPVKTARRFDALLSLIESDTGRSARSQLDEMADKQHMFADSSLDGAVLIRHLVDAAAQLQEYRERVRAAEIDAATLSLLAGARQQIEGAQQSVESFLTQSQVWSSAVLAPGAISREQRARNAIAKLSAELEAAPTTVEATVLSRRREIEAQPAALDPSPAFRFADRYGDEVLAPLAQRVLTELRTLSNDKSLDRGRLSKLGFLASWDERIADGHGQLSVEDAREVHLYRCAQRWYDIDDGNDIFTLDAGVLPAVASAGHDWRAELYVQWKLLQLFANPQALVGRTSIYRNAGAQQPATWSQETIESTTPVDTHHASWTVRRRLSLENGVEPISDTTISVERRGKLITIAGTDAVLLQLRASGDSVTVAPFPATWAGDLPPQLGVTKLALDQFRRDLASTSEPCLVCAQREVTRWYSPRFGLVREEIRGSAGTSARELVYAPPAQ